MKTKTTKERVQFAHKGGLVVRFHEHIGHRLNTDAQHSHGVAMMCYFLTGDDPSVDLLLSALTHDLAEQVTGDIPWPVKRRLGATQFDEVEDEVLNTYNLRFSLTNEERRTLRLADTLDGMLYCASEAALGNRTLNQIYYNWIGVLTKMGPFSQREDEVIKAVQQIWEESHDAKGTTYTVNAS